MAALGNALGDDVIRRDFVDRPFRHAIRPVLGVEEFGVRPRGCTITGTAGDDVLRGTRRADVICGLGGDDRIAGRGGNDAIYGDAGDDRIRSRCRRRHGLRRRRATTPCAAVTARTSSPAAPAPTTSSGGPGRDHLDGQGGGGRCDLDAADDEPGDC